MYFSPVVKERREDFFNYEEELSFLLSRLNEGSHMIVIKGRRRVGKSSLMRVAYNELRFPKAWVDARASAYGISGEPLFIDAFEELLSQASIAERIGSIVKEISVPPFTLALERRKYLVSLLSALKSVKGRMYLFIDEAQELLSQNLHYLLAQLYDSVPRLTMVLSGSEVGVVDRMLNDPTSPLYGRAYDEISMLPLSKEKAISFLLIGGQQAGISITPSEAERVEGKLDGIIGWLTWYGYYRKYLPEGEALAKVVEKAKELIKLEWMRFLDKRRNKEVYEAVAMALGVGMHSWEDIKAYVRGRFSLDVKDGTLSYVLRVLEAYSFVVKERRGYVFADPLMKELFNPSR